MKRHIAWILALLFYSCLPGMRPVFATDYWNINAKNVTGDNTGLVQGFTLGSASYTDNVRANDLITRGPRVDVRAFIPEALHARIAAGTYTDDVWVYLDTAVKYCNDNKKALYMPKGKYYISQALDLSAHTIDTTYYSLTVYSDQQGWPGLFTTATILAHSSFSLSADNTAPSYLMKISYGRGMSVENISFEDTYFTGTNRYLCAIGIVGFSSRNTINGVSVYNMYSGIRVGTSGVNANDDRNDFSNLSIELTEYAIVTSNTQTYITSIMNSGLSGRTSVFSNRVFGGPGGGEFRFYNCAFVTGAQPTGTFTGRSVVFDLHAGFTFLSVTDFHYEPADSTIMPALIVITGGATYSSTLFQRGYVNLGAVVSAVDNTDYKLITGLTTPGSTFSDIYFYSHFNLYIDGGYGPWKSSFERCWFEFSSIASGKTLIFTPGLNGYTLRGTVVHNLADDIKTYYESSFLSNKMGSYQQRLGFGDALSGWRTGDEPTDASWDNGSIIMKTDAAASSSSLQLGYQKIGGSWVNLFVSKTPIMMVAPANNTTACTAGTVGWDTGFVYVCTTDNNWKRATLSAY
jgi:hypothetical protein